MKILILNFLLACTIMLTYVYANSMQDGKSSIEKYVHQSMISTDEIPQIKWVDDKSGGSMLVLKYEDSLRTLNLTNEELNAAAKGTLPKNVSNQIKALVQSSDPNDQ